MDKLITLEAEIVTDTKLIVEGAAEVKINASESITAEIAPDTYVLGSIGSFNTASSWVGNYVNELVRESIGTGGSLKDALDWIRTDVMDQIEIGVNQTITQVENEFVSNSTLVTTLGSEIGGVRSSILDVKSTYATKTQAQAYSVDAIKASFGGNSSSSAIEAYIGSIAVAKVDADSATASTVATLIASMNNQTVRIDEMDEVLITTEGWAASASKLITAPDGSITGWEFADGSDSESEFKIKASNFSISDGTTGYTPFSIVGSDIQFNGTVSINKTQGSIFIGQYSSAPSTVSVIMGGVTYTLKDGDTYKNTSNNVVYYKSGASWVSTQGIAGTNGANGANGARGAISAFATYATLTPSDSQLAATINIIANPDGCIVGDNVTYTVSGTSGGTKMAYCTAAGNPGTWVSNVALYVNGDAIIAGTLAATKLQASTIWTDGSVQSSDFSSVGGTGFRLKANAADTYADPTIYGAYIRGGTIYGSTITASQMDAGSITTGTLNADRIVSGSLTTSSRVSFSNTDYTGTVASITTSNTSGTSNLVFATLNLAFGSIPDYVRVFRDGTLLKEWTGAIGGGSYSFVYSDVPGSYTYTVQVRLTDMGMGGNIGSAAGTFSLVQLKK